MEREKFASALQDYFRTRGITGEDIANHLGCSRQYVSALLSGKSSFGKKTAMKFSELYDLSYSWLLSGGEGQMMREPEQNSNNYNIHHNNQVNIGDISIKLDTIISELETLKEERKSMLAIIENLTRK